MRFGASELKNPQWKHRGDGTREPYQQIQSMNSRDGNDWGIEIERREKHNVKTNEKGGVTHVMENV